MKMIKALVLLVSVYAGSLMAAPTFLCPEIKFDKLSQYEGNYATIFYVRGASAGFGLDGAEIKKVRAVFKGVKTVSLIGEDSITLPEQSFEYVDRTGAPNFVYMVVHSQVDYCLTDKDGVEPDQYQDPSERVECTGTNTKKKTAFLSKSFRCKRQ